jgi:hypothetical protein
MQETDIISSVVEKVASPLGATEQNQALLMAESRERLFAD